MTFSVVDAVLQRSDISVTQLTTLDHLVTKSPVATTSTTAATAEYAVEGWQKTWEMPSTANYQGIPEKDRKWLKDHDEYGLFEAPKLNKSGDGGIKQRKLFKDKMLFNPPPVPTSLNGVIPHVFEFFHSSLFF